MKSYVLSIGSVDFHRTPSPKRVTSCGPRHRSREEARKTDLEEQGTPSNGSSVFNGREKRGRS